jgi:hypothetical protein
MSITETQMSRDFHDASGLIKLGEISYINCEIFNYPLNKIIQYKVFISKLIKDKGILDGTYGIGSAYLLGYYQFLKRKHMK